MLYPHIASGGHRYTPPRTTEVGGVGRRSVLYEFQSTAGLGLGSTFGEDIISKCAVAIHTEVIVSDQWVKETTRSNASHSDTRRGVMRSLETSRVGNVNSELRRWVVVPYAKRDNAVSSSRESRPSGRLRSRHAIGVVRLFPSDFSTWSARWLVVGVTCALKFVKGFGSLWRVGDMREHIRGSDTHHSNLDNISIIESPEGCKENVEDE